MKNGSRCERIQSLIPFLTEGNLDEGVRASIHQHAVECAVCAAALEFQLKLQLGIERHPLVPPPKHYFDGVLGEIHQRLPPKISRHVVDKDRTWVRETSGSAFVVTLALFWALIVFGPSLPEHLNWKTPKLFQSAMASPTQQLAAAASVQMARTLVYVQGFGLVDSNSPILKMPNSMRADIGLIALGGSDERKGRKWQTY